MPTFKIGNRSTLKNEIAAVVIDNIGETKERFSERTDVRLALILGSTSILSICFRNGFQPLKYATTNNEEEKSKQPILSGSIVDC